MKRRQFIKSGASLWALAPLLSAQFPSHVFAAATVKVKRANYLSSIDPLQTLNVANYASVDFNGDNIERPHDILWNTAGYLAKKGGIPAVSKHVTNIVVGGGMSGLISQYYLTKEQGSLLLEQDRILGGNSKGEVYKGLAYSIGAAYVTVPDEGSDIETFFKETELMEEFRHEKDSEVAAFMKNKLVHEFWSGVTAPEAKEQFEKLNTILLDILENKYPDIPHFEESQVTRDELNAWDSMSFETWIKQNIGPDVHPHLMEYFQLYCWSSFSGSIDELSAAQVLNFVASETSGVLALPGGNSHITSRLYKILSENEKSQIHAGAFVLQIDVIDDKVRVVYESAEGQIISVTCDKCVMAAPKFVAKRIIPSVAADQAKAWEDISYRGYIVGNILLNKKIASAGYDLFNLKGDVPETPAAMRPPTRVGTDVIFADWANNDQADQSILSIYRPLPYDGARQFLFSPMAHEKHKKAILDDVSLLLPTLGLSRDNIQDIRLTRWGHSLPVADKSWIASGQPELVTRPIEEKIYFVNQDNWSNSAFETCYTEAKTWTDVILGKA